MNKLQQIKKKIEAINSASQDLMRVYEEEPDNDSLIEQHEKLSFETLKALHFRAITDLEWCVARIETLENTLNEIIDICEDTTPLFPLDFIDQRREQVNIAKQTLKGKEG